MRSSKCHQFDRRLRDFSEGVDTWASWLDRTTDMEDCIAEGLLRSRSEEDWGTWDLYVIAAGKHPSRKFTHDLCEVLRLQINEVNNEDIIDAIAAIGDPSAVGRLEETLWWEPEWDEFRGIAIKVIWALAAISTPEAIRVLREAADTADERTRKCATSSLREVNATSSS